MKDRFCILRVCFFFVGTALTSFAGPIVSLNDYGFNVNGNLYLSGGTPLPSYFDTSGFDFSTGLGTVNIAYTPGMGGNYYVLAYFDHDIDVAINTAFNEIGLVNGTPVPGQSWQIGDPNQITLPNLFDNFAHNTLDRVNHATSPGDVAMAMGLSFAVLTGQTEQISFTTSSSPPTSRFYLQQNDTASQANIYFSASAGGNGPRLHRFPSREP